MRIQLMSDLHLEHHRDQGVEFVNKMSGVDVDVLVLAGDILSLKHSHWPVTHFSQICSKHKDVVYVPGNHEYYGAIPNRAEANLSDPRLPPNLHILKAGEFKIIGGKRFLGGTLWFPDHPNNTLYKDMMSDFNLIKRFEPWVYERNQLTVENFNSQMQKGDIVVTHHLPTDYSVHPIYSESVINCFFVTDLEKLIREREPAIWLHGHTHEKLDYILGSTRVVSNALGYPGERLQQPFDDHKYIDL